LAQINIDVPRVFFLRNIAGMAAQNFASELLSLIEPENVTDAVAIGAMFVDNDRYGRLPDDYRFSKILNFDGGKKEGRRPSPFICL
jgi:hypothetical protein